MPLNGNSSARRPRRWWLPALAVLAAVGIMAALVSRRDDPIPVRVAVVEQGTIRVWYLPTEKSNP